MNAKKLISDDGENLSLGRVTFWLLTIILLYFWYGKSIFLFICGVTKENVEIAKEIFVVPDGLVSTWSVLTGYNGIKKFTNKKDRQVI